MTSLAKMWKRVDLGEVVEFYDRLRIPLSSKERATRQGPYPYYGASGIIDHIDGYLFEGRYLLVAEDGENLNSRKLPIAFFADGKFWVNNHAHIIKGVKGTSDDDFLKYWFAASDISGYVTGTAQPKLSQSNMKQIRINLPPYTIQLGIASILSAYDDLIENNTRRIAILEEMARRLYQEWFVHFRFPGHEKVKMVESELGPIPEGWEVVHLNNLVTTQYGYTASAQAAPVGPKFLRGMDINKTSYIDWSNVPYCEVEPKKLAKFTLKVGDILVIRMADPGKVGLVEVEVDAVFASYLVRLQIANSRVTPLFLFHYLTDALYQGYITGASTGTTRKSASAGVITGVQLALPSSGLINDFEEIVAPIRSQINLLLRKNANLRIQRDLLLPKLISGEIDVSTLSAPMESQAA